MILTICAFDSIPKTLKHAVVIIDLAADNTLEH